MQIIKNGTSEFPPSPGWGYRKGPGPKSAWDGRYPVYEDLNMQGLLVDSTKGYNLVTYAPCSRHTAWAL